MPSINCPDKTGLLRAFETPGYSYRARSACWDQRCNRSRPEPGTPCAFSCPGNHRRSRYPRPSGCFSISFPTIETSEISFLCLNIIPFYKRIVKFSTFLYALWESCYNTEKARGGGAGWKNFWLWLICKMTLWQEPWDEGGLCHHREGAAEDPVLDCRGGEVVFTRDTHGRIILKPRKGENFRSHIASGVVKDGDYSTASAVCRGQPDFWQAGVWKCGACRVYPGWRIRSSGDDRSLYRYLRGVQCTACQGICAGAAGFGGCVLLCWRHFREPSCGIMYNENVPNFSKIEKNMVKMWNKWQSK